MIKRMMSFLSPYIPLGIAVKGLEKVNPKMKSFFGGALAAGYTANEALDFLRNETSGNQQNLRPDELATQNRRELENQPLRIAQGAAVLGASALGGLGAAAATGVNEAANQVQKPQGTSETPQESTQAPQAPQDTETKQYDPLAGLQKFPALLHFIRTEKKAGTKAVDIAKKAKKHMRLSIMVNAIEQNIDEPFETMLARLLGEEQEAPQAQKAPGNGLDALKQSLNQLLALRGKK